MRRRAARNARSSFAAACPGRSRASSTAAAAAGLPARSSASARRSGDLVALRFGARQLAQQRDVLSSAPCRRVPRAGQDRERGVDEAAARRRALFELQGVVVRRQRGVVVAGGGQRAGTAGERGHGLRRDPQDLLEAAAAAFESPSAASSCA